MITVWDMVGRNAGYECAKFAEKSFTELYRLRLGSDTGDDNS